MEQTTSRLRKTFRYPTDNDSDDSLPEALDEEEQDTLISTLEQENRKRNDQYAHILLALPLLCTVLYIPTLFHQRTTILSFLSISSLLSTAYLLYILPPGITLIPILDALNSRSSNTLKASVHSSRLGQLGLLQSQDRGPIATYLPYLNLGLCVLLFLAGSVSRGRDELLWWGFEMLPAGVCAVVLLAKVIMGSVDPQAELRGLKYGLKGA